MSLPNSKSVASSLRELLNYVRSLGEYINQIYKHLDKIEKNINIVKEELEVSIKDNKKDLESLKVVRRVTLLTKSEFNDLIQKLPKLYEQSRSQKKK